MVHLARDPCPFPSPFRKAAAISTSSCPLRPRSLFLNVVGEPQQRTRPEGIPDAEWRQALTRVGGELNADHLWPVLAVGFRDLSARRDVEEATVAEDTARRERVGELLRAYKRNLDVSAGSCGCSSSRRRYGP